MNLIDRLIALGNIEESQIPDNPPSSYLPIRSKGNFIDYSIVSGSVLGMIMGKELRNPERFDIKEFEEACIDKLSGLLDDDTILDHIRQMYFTNDALYRASPEFLLLACRSKELQGKGKKDQTTKHLVEILRSFFSSAEKHCNLKSKANFVELIFINVLKANLTTKLGDSPKGKAVEPYLPFLVKLFLNDINYLCSNTDNLLSYFHDFLQLYNFLYCSQLALNVGNWSQGEPKSQPLYFILDTEKASQERSFLRQYGYSSLYNAYGRLFPVLSMLDNFNKQDKTGDYFPLWSYGNALSHAEFDTGEVTASLGSYAEAFRKKRKIKPRQVESDSPEAYMRLIVKYSLDQFEQTRYLSRASRHEIRDAYQKQFEEHIAKHFMQVRGRSGRVLVMNQDYLLLLTNIAIGAKRQLRFQELLKEFRARGVYFDKQSEQALIAFFERVGNVDRMSDSGDAVYVRSTI